MRKLKKVTWLPEFILRLKGSFDSKHGKEVCNTYVNKLHRKSTSIESAAVKAVEKNLIDLRKQAVVLLSIIKDDSGIEPEASEIVDSKKRVREQRKKLAEKQKKKNANNELLVISETINSVETEMDEVVNYHRNQTESKIKAYVIGIRKKIKDYESPVNMDNSAREIYHERHRELDESIHRTISNYIG